ncbi:MAG: hypothetical protein ACRDZZ_02000, partial [Ilumatobacteraceae bacterium]
MWSTRGFRAAGFMPDEHPWTCQLMHLDVTGSAFIFDLVALEPSSEVAIDVDIGVPFTVVVDRDDERLTAASTCEAVTTWAAAADVITIRAGHQLGSSWLC